MNPAALRQTCFTPARDEDLKMLKDKNDRIIDYLRISLTEACNFHCFYCKSTKKIKKHYSPQRIYLKNDEVFLITKAFSEFGISHIRLSGGEPLLRKDLCMLVKQISRLSPVKDLSLTTNGFHLDKYAQSLKSSGMQRVNISLDSIVPSKFKEITGGGDLQKVLKGIDAAIEAGLTPLKINMVVMKGINDDELIPMVKFCIKKKAILRLIECMPIGNSALDVSKNHMPSNEIRNKVAKYFSLEKTTMHGPGPAWYEYIKGDGLVIGFISAVSQHFCKKCNRIRLTATGKLHLCLGHEKQVDLAAIVRRPDVSILELKRAIQAAVLKKPDIHCFDKHGATANRRIMSAIGG